MAYVDRTPHTLTLIIGKKYALTLGVWKAKCPGTRHPECICCGRDRPEATCLNTGCQEEIRPDTRRLEGICRGICRPVGICCGGSRPDTTYLNTRISFGRKGCTLTLITWKANAVPIFV